jgi:alpha-L-rhamnosidase
MRLINKTILYTLLSFLSGSLLLAGKSVEGSITFKALYCESKVNPIGIDNLSPRFSWIPGSGERGLMQTAYRILVSENVENLNRNIGDRWNSGKVVSDRSVNIKYEGKSLTSGEKLYWKVQVWDKNLKGYSWSEIATFEMGLMNENDWKGKWIGTRIFNDLQYTDGFSGQAVLLKGVDQSIKSRFHRGAGTPNGITISAWIKPQAFTDDWQTIYRKDDGRATQVLAIGNKNGQKGIWFGLPVSGVYEEDCAELTNNYFQDSKWHLVSVTYDNFAKRIYIDGQELKTISNPGRIYPSGFATAFIGSFNNQKDFFKGEMDEVRLYGIALSGENIKQLFNKSEVSTDLIGWWKFEGDLYNSTTHRSNPPVSAQLIRKEFEINKEIKKARIYFSGLGLSELYLNGKKVSDDLLSPAFTDYTKIVKYMTYDITNELKMSTNAIGVILGNGWYSAQVQDYDQCWSKKPQLLLQMNIEFKDGSTMNIVSDRSWKIAPAPITENDIDFGEKYDARMEMTGWDKHGFNDSNWMQAEVDQGPAGKLTAQLMPGMRIVETLKPVKLTNPEPGIYVFTFDQIFGGWAKLRMKGNRGDTVIIEYSTRMLKNGLIDDIPWPGEQESDQYILKGDPVGEAYEPRFTYHPVQFVQIRGLRYTPELNDIEGRIVRTNEDLTGDFKCSNELFNTIHNNVNRTLSNSLKGFLQDCLHREKYSYNEPSNISSSLFTRKFMPLFWKKFATDIRMGSRTDGSIGDVTPAFPGKPREPDVSQGAAYAMLVWYLYQAYDDPDLLSEHYQTIKNWIDYITNNMCDGEFVVKGWLGDHMVPGYAPGYEKWLSDETPQSLPWTALYYRNVRILSDMAKVIGITEDAVRYNSLAEKIKNAINDKWLDKNNCHYASGSQTSELIPLSLGIVPEEHQEKLIRNIEYNIIHNDFGHLRVGHAGLIALVESLTTNGLGETMFGIVNTTDYPGWGYMVQHGATTIWECWGRDYATEGGRRREDNMMMLGMVIEFFYRNIAGIQGPNIYGTENMKPGYREFKIKPYPVGDLAFANANVNTVRGEIRSAWEKTNNTFKLEVTIPVNSEAYVSIPKSVKKSGSVFENGNPVWENGKLKKGYKGIYEGNETTDYITLKVGSGNYSFLYR